jgi:hypothetical protein
VSRITKVLQLLSTGSQCAVVYHSAEEPDALVRIKYSSSHRFSMAPTTDQELVNAIRVKCIGPQIEEQE